MLIELEVVLLLLVVVAAMSLGSKLDMHGRAMTTGRFLYPLSP